MRRDLSHLRVLIVEDNRINQLLVKNMLKNFGILHADAVDDGNAALSNLSEKEYDVILMDIQMPEMDGYEITRLIRAGAATRNSTIPIIAMTGESKEKDAGKANESGMNEYVVKPFTPEKLYSTFIKCLESPGAFSAVENIIPTEKKMSSSHIKKKKGMDLRFLEKFTGGDLALTAQLIETFLRDVPEAIRNLEVSIPLMKWKEVHRISHKVKSCFAVFELNNLKKIIVRIEDCSRDAIALDEIPGLFNEFKNNCSEAIVNLQSELKKLNGQLS